MCALLWLTLPASAESRAGTYTPQQLHDQSTVVFKGTVTRVETVAKYRKAFPVRAKVAAVLKGKLAGKDVSFGYKPPGKYAIFEAEFNKPEVGRKGTFYLKDFSGTLVLIGYIAKPAADQAAVLKAAVEKLKSDRPAIILEGVRGIAAGNDDGAWSKLLTAMATEDVLKRLERPGLEGPMFKEAKPLEVKFKILASALRAIAEGPPARAIPALTWLVDQDVYVKTYTRDRGNKLWRAYLAYDALQYVETATPDLLKFCARKLTQKDTTLNIRIMEALAAYGTPESIALFEKYLWRYGDQIIALIKHRDRYECTRLLLSVYRGATVEKYVHRSLRQFFAKTYRTGSRSWPLEIKLPEIRPATKAEAEKFSKLFRGFLKDHGKITLTLEEIAAFQALIGRCDRIAKAPASQPAGAASGAEATVSALARYARGNPLTIIVTLRNQQQKPVTLWTPTSVTTSGLDSFFRHHGSCSLVRVQAGAPDGKRPAGDVPGGRQTKVANRFRMNKWPVDTAKKQVVSGGKSVRFTFDLRQVFRLPADERGSYHFRIISVNPRFAASANFRIGDDPNVLQEKFLTWPSRSDREPEITRRYCTVKTATPSGPAYTVVQQAAGWANRTIVRTPARPVALWATRLHENAAMIVNVQLVWLDEKAQLWLLPPHLLWRSDKVLQWRFKTTVKSAVDIKSVQLVTYPPDWKLGGTSLQTIAFDVGVALDDGSVTHRYLLYKRYSTISEIDQAQYAKLKRKAKEYRPPKAKPQAATRPAG